MRLAVRGAVQRPGRRAQVPRAGAGAPKRTGGQVLDPGPSTMTIGQRVGAAPQPGPPPGHPRRRQGRPRPAAGQHRCRSTGSGGAGHRRPAGRLSPGDLAAGTGGFVAAWSRTLPWRVAATLGIGRRRRSPRQPAWTLLGLVMGVLAAVAAGWGLRFRVGPEPSPGIGERWGSGAPPPLGCPERHGWVVLHDLAVPAAGPTPTTR
jgi:hypothetical protein